MDTVKEITTLRLQSQGFSRKGAEELAAGADCSSPSDKSRARAMSRATGLPCPTTSPGPVPVPYPNVGSLSDLGKGTGSKVKLGGKKALTMKSTAGRSQGNEAGTLKSLISQVNYPRKRNK